MLASIAIAIHACSNMVNVYVYINYTVTGRCTDQWSLITTWIGNDAAKYVCTCIYIAFAVYTRSPAAYEALKSFQILKLPSRKPSSLWYQ